VPYVREMICDGFSGILTSLPASSVNTRPVELFSTMQPVSMAIERKQQKKIRKNFFIIPLKEQLLFMIRTNIGIHAILIKLCPVIRMMSIIL
jgi:hypothetical protein